MYELVDAVQGVADEESIPVALEGGRTTSQIKRCRTVGCARLKCHWCRTLGPTIKRVKEHVWAAARGVQDRSRWIKESAKYSAAEIATTLCALALLGPGGSLMLQFFVDALRHILLFEGSVQGPIGFGFACPTEKGRSHPAWTPEMTNAVARAVRAVACDDDACTLMAHFPLRSAGHSRSCAEAVRTLIRVAEGGVAEEDLTEYKSAGLELRECSRLWGDLWTIGEREFAKAAYGVRIRGPPPIVRHFMALVALRSNEVFEMYGGDTAVAKLSNPVDRPGTARPMTTGVVNLQSQSGEKCREIPPYSIDSTPGADAARCKKKMVDAFNGGRGSLTELVTAVCPVTNTLRHGSVTANEVSLNKSTCLFFHTFRYLRCSRSFFYVAQGSEGYFKRHLRVHS
jgi:hypothetical protein